MRLVNDAARIIPQERFVTAARSVWQVDRLPLPRRNPQAAYPIRASDPEAPAPPSLGLRRVRAWHRKLSLPYLRQTPTGPVKSHRIA